MKRIFPAIALIILPILAYCANISDIGLPEWESMPVYQKAELMLQSKAQASKSKEDSENYIHIQTLISLSSPLTAEQNKELVKDAVDILQKHPEWGNIKSSPSVVQPPVVTRQQTYVSETVSVPASTEATAAVPSLGSLEKQLQSNNIQAGVNLQNNIQDNVSNIHDQQQNLEDALQKYNEQKKLIVTTTPTEYTNKKPTVVTGNNEQNKNLFADGDFPTGQYYKVEHLDGMPLNKEYKAIYYFIETLIVDYPINNSYICHLDESAMTQISSFFFK